MPDFDSDVKREHIRNQTVAGNFVFLNFRRQPEAVKKPENERHNFRIRLNAEPSLKRAQVVESFINHRQTDNRVNQKPVDVRPEIHAQKHRRRMTDGEKADVNTDVFKFIKKENHAEQKQNVVISGEHMFRAEIDERQKMRPRDFLNIAFVAFGNAVRESRAAEQ